MALKESGVCSVCGRELKGRVFNCTDGVYCGDCRKKAFLVFPGETADLHTADEVREKLEKYSDAIANRDKVLKPEYCPVCSKKLPKLMNLRILDDYICMDCAEKAAGFIGAGYDSVSCMLLSEILPLFDRAEVRGGREDSDGVFVEADALRVAFPLIKTYVEDEFDVVFIDPLDSMSPEELKKASETAERRRAELRDIYGRHKAVFCVDDIAKLHSESRGRVFYRDEYRISDRVLLGRIDPGDEAEVRRKEGRRVLKIKKLGDCRSWVSDLKELKEGAEGSVFAEGALSFVYPGDILYID